MSGEHENWSLPVEEKHFDNALEVVRGLYAIPRTGWVKRGVENPETVGEHTDAMVALGEAVADKIPGLDKKKLLRMLQVHDWPEYIEGDVVTATIPVEERKEAEDKKFAAELAAMKTICSRLGKEGEINLALWLEFEEAASPEASIAKQIDKLQAMIKAAEYEKAGNGRVVAQRFIDGQREIITHPVLLEILSGIDKKK
jgi:putative hydrolases of HD superfamily